MAGAMYPEDLIVDHWQAAVGRQGLSNAPFDSAADSWLRVVEHAGKMSKALRKRTASALDTPDSRLLPDILASVWRPAKRRAFRYPTRRGTSTRRCALTALHKPILRTYWQMGLG